MGRRSGFTAAVMRYQREVEKQRRAESAAIVRAQREAERAEKAMLRAQAADEKEQKRLYLESRAADVDLDNEELTERMAALGSLLSVTLGVDDYLDFEALKEPFEPPSFEPGKLGKPVPPVPALELPERPGGLKKLLGRGSAEYANAVEEAKAAHARAEALQQSQEEQRVHALEAARESHAKELERLRAEAAERNADVDELRSRFERGDPDAIITYFGLVLDSSSYPDGFPQRSRLAFVPESKQLVVEHELPPVSVVPDVKQFRYMKTKDEITSTNRSAKEVRDTYGSMVAQVALRTLHEILEADRSRQVESLVFNGVVDAINRATGQPERPCILSVRTTRETFEALDLANVDPEACLKGLSASVSRRPEELAPVRPILEFSMVDPRFVEEENILAGLDQRPNLMELTPSEFESLITNLFERMGLETRMTQASRDGGVDCVAFDSRPIFGGKVVIQAKRYKSTVGVSAVRDLFGTVQNEGASKGILVTTSGFGKASFEFADGKPLELLSGSNLLYLLSQHADLEARIEPPDGWVDPREPS